MALEEYLLENIQDGEIILYLWQNQNTIVIGKNQNPWRECRVSLAEKDHILIARRLSGGGAVFHDLGNLNFTFIMKKELYNLDKQLETIIMTAKDLGINAVFTGKNDIAVQGKKFSGNAFYFGEEGYYHHGTILVSTDLTRLGHYLQVSPEKMRSKGIDSVESRVVNLVDLNPEVTVDHFSQGLVKSFETIYKSSAETIQLPPKQLLQGKIEKNKAWEWLFSQTPKFDIQLEKRFDFGHMEFLFYLKDSRINKVIIYSDTVMVNILAAIQKVLIGAKFNIRAINKRLDGISTENLEEENMISQIQVWLEKKEI